MDNTLQIETSITNPVQIFFQDPVGKEYSLSEIVGRRSVRRLATKPNDGLFYSVTVGHQLTKENSPFGSERTVTRFDAPYLEPASGKEVVASIIVTQVYPQSDFPIGKMCVLRNALQALVINDGTASDVHVSDLAQGISAGQI
jgi:hypothetical protein